MVAVWVFGLLLAWQGNWWASAPWFHAKFALVAAADRSCITSSRRWRKTFEADRNTKPARYYRYWNEVPTLLMIGIVFLVVLKPF